VLLGLFLFKSACHFFSLKESLLLFLLKEKELPKGRDAGKKVQGQPDRSPEVSGFVRAGVGKSQGIENKK
jgi:hypothetical protein